MVVRSITVYTASIFYASCEFLKTFMEGHLLRCSLEQEGPLRREVLPITKDIFSIFLIRVSKATRAARATRTARVARTARDARNARTTKANRITGAAKAVSC